MEGVIRKPRTTRRAPPDETALTFLRAAGRLYHEVETALEPTGLTYHDYRALEQLGADRSMVVTVATESGEEAAPDASPVDAEVVERLERAGLVRRSHDGDDRSVRAERTALGSARAREARKRLDALVARFGSLLEGSDRAGLRRLLARLERLGVRRSRGT